MLKASATLHSCTHNCCTLMYHMSMCRRACQDNTEYISNAQYNSPLVVIWARSTDPDRLLSYLKVVLVHG